MTDTTIKALEPTSGGTDLAAISFTQGSTVVKAGKSTIVDENGLPVSFATDSLQTAGNASLTAINGKLPALLGGFVPVAVQNFPGTQPVSGPLTDTQLGASAIPFNIAQVNGATPSQTNPLIVFSRANDLCVSSTAAAAAALTVTLPAAGAGLFHYIDVIEITMYASAAGTGGATPVVVTSTNLPGAMAWTFPSGRAIGVNYDYRLSANRALRSSVANTATTIVCPATTGVIWRVNVVYTTSV